MLSVILLSMLVILTSILEVWSGITVSVPPLSAGGQILVPNFEKEGMEKNERIFA